MEDLWVEELNRKSYMLNNEDEGGEKLSYNDPLLMKESVRLTLHDHVLINADLDLDE